MAFGPPICTCCGTGEEIEQHHLYPRAEGCPDDLTVWLCHACHGRAHDMRRRIDIRAATKAARALVVERRKEAGLLLPDGARPSSVDRARQVTAKGTAVRQAKAAARALDLAPLVAAWRAAGIISQTGIARALNAAGIQTTRGCQWKSTQVGSLLRRLKSPL